MEKSVLDFRWAVTESDAALVVVSVVFSASVAAVVDSKREQAEVGAGNG